MQLELEQDGHELGILEQKLPRVMARDNVWSAKQGPQGQSPQLTKPGPREADILRPAN